MQEAKFVLLCDTTANLPEQWYIENEVRYIAHGLVVDGEEIWDDFGKTFSPKAMYDACRQGKKMSTLQGRLEDFTDLFTTACKEGMDVLYVGFSSALSGTYQTSCIAAEYVMEQFPGRTIVCFDSKGATMGHGIQVMAGLELRNQGLSAKEAGDALQARMLNACHFFTVDDLNHLYRGGRLSKTSAVVGSLMGIKPIMHVNDEGKLIPNGKVRGRKTAMDALAKHTKAHIQNPQDQTVYICHGDCADDAELLADMVRTQVPGSKIAIYPLSPIIGVHSGPGTLTVFFWGDRRL